MNASLTPDLIDRRLGFVIHGAIFLASAGIISMLKLLSDDDEGARLRYLVCLIGVWSVILAMHYAAPRSYQRINPTDYEAVQSVPSKPRHFYRDVHVGLFLGLNSFAWITTLAEIWERGLSINELWVGSIYRLWGCLVLPWAILFFIHLSMSTVSDNHALKANVSEEV
jgi:hypothetical protein